MGTYLFSITLNILPFFAVVWGVLCALKLVNPDRPEEAPQLRAQCFCLAKAALIGMAFVVLFQLWLAITQPVNPVYQWIIASKSRSPWYRPLLMANELSQYLVFAIPTSWLLLKLRPFQPTSVLVAFLLPALLAKYQFVLMDNQTIREWAQWMPRLILDGTLFPIVYVAAFKLNEPLLSPSG